MASNLATIRIRLGNLIPAARKAAADALGRGLDLVRSSAQRDYMSGPRPGRLGVVTARLRNSISWRVKDTRGAITGRIGTTVPYGRYHEFGFRGIVDVRGHTRVTALMTGKGRAIRSSTLSSLRGAIRDSEGNLVGFKRSLKTVSQSKRVGLAMIAYVRPHSRQVNYPGRPYLRPAIAGLIDRIRELVTTAVSAAVKTT